MSDGASRAGRLRGLLRGGEPVPLAVTGGSMAPFLRPGDVVDLAPLGPEEPPAVGELVARGDCPGGRVVVHRVVATAGDRVVTRGDASPSADDAIAATEILGRVVAARRAGRRLRLGLGPERRLVAWLSRRGWWMRLVDRFRALR